jgi:hypothetical protein
MIGGLWFVVAQGSVMPSAAALATNDQPPTTN